MTWVAASTITTGDLVTAANWNNLVKGNAEHLRAGGFALASQAVGDVLYADTTTSYARLAAGTSGYLLKTQGAGSAPVWAASTAHPAGSDTQVQFNNSGALAGDAGLTYNASTDALTVAGDLVVDGTSLFVDASENRAGIGTATPDGSLHVHTATAGSVVASSLADDLVVENSADGGMSILTPDASFSAITFGSPSDATGAVLQWKLSTLLMTLGTTRASGALSFYTGNSAEAMRIDASGNVGIGTATPGFTTGSGLQVLRTGSATVRVQRTDSTGTAGEFTADSATVTIGSVSGHSFGILTDNTLRLTVAAGGDVGIGTTTPGTTVTSAVLPGLSLHIENASNDSNILISGDTPILHWFDRGGGSNDRWMQLELNSGNLIFRDMADDGTVGLDNILVVDGSSGDVGIGIASPGFTSGSGLQVLRAGSATVRVQRTDLEATAGEFTADSATVTIGSVSGHSFAIKTDNTVRLTVAASGAVAVVGVFTAGTKTFQIPHPLPELKETHHLIHGCLEGPRLDLLYRGTVTLVAGAATVDLDEAAGMSAGTWVLLCREHCTVYTTNESGWDAVRGSVSGSTLTIECQDVVSIDTVSWMVVAERQDDEIKAQSSTDGEGHLILEPLKPPDSAGP